MKFDNRIIGALRKCDTKEQISDIFSRFGVGDVREKQRYLLYTMYAPSLFFSFSNPPTDEQIYECTLIQFMQGSWRLAPLYDIMRSSSNSPLSKSDQDILKKLNTCTTSQEVDTVFEQQNITSLRERCNILRRCMGVQKILSEVGTFSEQDDYDFDRSVFLGGSWRRMS